MKRLISILILTLVLVMAAAPSGRAAVMEDYCSAPPYVTRSIPPNIMILLDNSCDMLNAAYDHSVAYNNDTSTSTYAGYFIPDAYYYGGTQNRFQVVATGIGSTDPYIQTGYSGFDIVFKGNFLNYMSMSRFDLLQKILTGGNSAVPRQAGGASVVRSSSGSACAGASTSWNWTDSFTYSGCVFVVDSGEFRIEDESAGACGLLTTLNVARAPSNTFFAWILKKLGLMDAYETLVAKLRGTVRSFAKSLEKIDVATKVHAAGPYAVTFNTSSPLSSATAGAVSISRTIQATVSNGTAPYYLSFSKSSGSFPPGIDFSATTCTTPSTDPGSCSITLSGAPSTAGTYYFTLLVTATDSKSPNARVATITKEYIMTINEASAINVNITTPTLPSGVVNTTFTNSTPVTIPDGGAQGTEGTPAVSTINVTGLPITDTVATLASVKVNISIGYVGDLRMKLTSPSGTEIWLEKNFNLTYPYGVNFTDTVFSRSAITSILNGTAPYAGSFSPEQPFTNLTGLANGTWTLTVIDVWSGYVGTLNNWTLAFYPTATAATYSQTLSAVASGGTGTLTYTWSVTSGSLPPGLQFNASTGEIYGAPTTAGSYIFTVQVSATDGTVTGTASRELTIVIGEASGRRTKAYRLWVDVGKDYYNNSLPAELSTGLVQKYWGKAKWGITNFDQAGNNVRIKVNECIGANNVSTFLNSLDGAVPTNVTSAPLATAYYGVVKYFQNLGQNVDWQGGCQDPFRNDTVSCRKNFILTLSSVYNVSGASFIQAEADCPTDYGNSGAKLVQNACYGYKNDQRTTTIGASNVAGEQKLYHFAVYTFGADTESAINNSGAATSDRLANKRVLEDAAKAGSPIKRFYDASQGVDLQTQLMKAIDDILAQAASGTAVSVLTTSSRGIGSMVQAYFLPATLQETREIMWTGYLQNLWIDPTDNLREDTTHDAQLITASTGTSANGDKVVKLFFDTNTNETKAATFTTEDDGTGGTLGSCSAPASAIKPFNSVEYLWEAGKSLALRSPSGLGGRKIFTSKVVTRVTSTPAAGTTITTTLDGTTNPSSPAFTIGMDGTMKAALNPDATYTADNIIKYIRGECLETTNPQLDGDCPSSSPTLNPSFRDRRMKVYSSPTSSVLAPGANNYGNVWKLGDIISSTPKVLANTPLNTYHIDYGDNTYFQYISDTTTINSYKNRSAISFVGANDGMVHAFRVGYLKDKGLAAGVKGLFKNFFNSDDNVHDRLGEEVWAYIPHNAFPYLKYLADPGYCHIYYNDLSVRLVDASLGCASDSECDEPGESRKKASWHTVLIGGMRFGGACSGADANPAEPPTGTPADVGYSAYFAIDITDPENPVPLWEFSDDDMGYSTTFPSVIRTGGRTHNGNWYVAIGSGSKQLPKSNVDIARTNIGHVYFLNLKTGALVKKLDLNDHAGIVGDILGIDADKDYHSEKIYFGTAYNESGWKGKLAAVDIPNQELSSSSTTTLRYLFTGNNAFTASPDAARDTDGNVWVYAGSGKYYGDVDEAETVQQIFFGLKDKSSGVTYPVSVGATGFEDKTNVNTTGVVTGTSTVCTYDGTGFSNVDVVTSINRTSSVTSAPDVGWFVKLETSPRVERVISRPLAVGGLVDFLTYVPSSSVCDYGGNSYLYSLGFTSGEAPASVAIRASGATGGVTTMGSNVTVSKRVLLGPGAPPSGEAIIVPPPKEDREALKKKIQVATGVIIEAENSPVTSVKSKILHWLRK